MRWLLVAEERVGQDLVRRFGPDAEHPLVGVMSTSRVIQRLARKRGVAVRETTPDTLAGLGAWCAEEGAELVANVHSLARIPIAPLSQRGVAALSVHPSPLPDLAGLYPFLWAIALGRSEHGVTLHHMEEAFDSGHIVAQARWPLAGDETATSLYERGADEAFALVTGLLAQPEPDLRRRLSEARPQGPGRSYYGLRAVREPVFLEPAMSCAQASALVRSRDFRPYPAPWPLPLVELDGRPRRVRGLAQDAAGQSVAFRDGALTLDLARESDATP